ncbi:MAG: hypothetical protein P4N41_10915 [Negativicutes bacterium]|nr:hypothetical protein [Negativicutes bacterium]
MAKEKNGKQGSPVQGEPNAFSGFEKKCGSGKSTKGKSGKA